MRAGWVAVGCDFGAVYPSLSSRRFLNGESGHGANLNMAALVEPTLSSTVAALLDFGSELSSRARVKMARATRATRGMDPTNITPDDKLSGGCLWLGPVRFALDVAWLQNHQAVSVTSVFPIIACRGWGGCLPLRGLWLG